MGYCTLDQQILYLHLWKIYFLVPCRRFHFAQSSCCLLSFISLKWCCHCFLFACCYFFAGTWDPHAMTVITQYIELGENSFKINVYPTTNTNKRKKRTVRDCRLVPRAFTVDLGQASKDTRKNLDAVLAVTNQISYWIRYSNSSP